jgi:hypothetical protein
MPPIVRELHDQLLSNTLQCPVGALVISWSLKARLGCLRSRNVAHARYQVPGLGNDCILNVAALPGNERPVFDSEIDLTAFTRLTQQLQATMATLKLGLTTEPVMGTDEFKVMQEYYPDGLRRETVCMDASVPQLLQKSIVFALPVLNANVHEMDYQFEVDQTILMEQTADALPTKPVHVVKHVVRYTYLLWYIDLYSMSRAREFRHESGRQTSSYHVTVEWRNLRAWAMERRDHPWLAVEQLCYFVTMVQQLLRLLN